MRAFSFIPLIGLAVIVLVAKSGLFTAGANTAGLGVLLLILCLWPAVAWAVGGMRHLPLFEVYCFMHLLYYWVPAGKAGGEILGLESEQRFVVLGALCLFLVAGQGAYFGVLRSLKGAQRGSWRIWGRQVPSMQGGTIPWVLVCLWLAYNTAFQFGFLWDVVPWQAVPLVRAFCVVSGLLGIFVLGLKAGQGRLPQFQVGLFALAVTAGTLISYASGYLAVGTVFAGNAFFAYAMGARRLPVVSLLLFLASVSFLNYGKGDMRARYWAMGESSGDLVEFYSYWFKSSWEQFNLPADQRRGAISALERANLTSVYVQVVTQTPHPLPFLGGKTYVDSMKLFIPRIISPDRLSLHVIMNEVGLRYGIHTTVESTESTMISLGQIGEAWANGGWLAVGLVGAFFGLFFSVGVRVAYQRDYSTVGFLFGMTFVGFAVNLEHLTGTLLMTFYQTAIVTLMLLYWFSRSTSQSASPAATRAATGSSVAPETPVGPLAPSRAGE
jgi:hypothetical protein